MEQEDNRPIPEIGQEKKTDWLVLVGYLFLPVLFGLSWIRYELGSRPLFTDSDIASYALATFLVFSNYLFPAKGYKAMSAFIFVISLFFSLSASTESIDKVYAKNKKTSIPKKEIKPTLPACPDSFTNWNAWDECMRKFPQAEAERLAHNKEVGEYNDSLPAKNAEIEKFNTELSYRKLSLQSQIVIILYMLLAIGIPTIEMYSVYVFHNNKSEKGTSQDGKTEIKIVFPWTKPNLDEAMQILVDLRKWDSKTATDKLQSIGFSNVEIAKILNLHKSTISRKQSESRRQPTLIALPTKRNDKQPELFRSVKEA